MNADGSNPVRLTNNPAGDQFPMWSPDGSKITFTSERDGNGEIYVMDADGSNPINLTTNPANDISSDWSPDGTKLVFLSDRTGQWAVYTMNIDGTNQTQISTEGVTDGAWPNWQRVLEEPDNDRDGVPNDEDECPNSDVSTTVIIDDCNTGVPNTLFPSGCTISDLIVACAEGASNHGQFVSCVSHVTNDLKKAAPLLVSRRARSKAVSRRQTFPNITSSEHTWSE